MGTIMLRWNRRVLGTLEGFGAFTWRIPILITVTKAVLRHSKLFEGFKVQLGEDLIQARRGGLRAGGEEMDFRSFMIQGVDGEFNFLPEGGLDENQSFTKYMNNEALVINAEPISSVRPSNIAENMDSHNILYDEGGLSPISLEKVPAQASKVAGYACSPLDVDSDPDIHEFPSAKELKDATDCHWVVAHVTLPFWKQYLREISIQQLCDIHDNTYMRQAVLDNVLNARTQELISALHTARASCDTMREKEIKKDKAYAELEQKCNKALQDLDKNPLVFYMCAEVETLKSQEVDSLRQDRAIVVSRVIPDATIKLIHNDEMGVLIARLVKASIIYGRCTAFEEVTELKKPFVLGEMPGYRPSSKEEYERVGNDLAHASYPFLAELTADPYASMEQLLSKKPQSLQLKRRAS
nr:hypothetical protein [Tanacetum cinerariifolium]